MRLLALFQTTVKRLICRVKRHYRFCLTIVALTLMALWKHRLQAIEFAQTPTKLG
jgi:hypothetical protein